MIKRQYTFVLLLLLLFPAAVKSTQEEGPSFTLEECISIAISENPLIQSSFHQYQASLARIKQAKAFNQPSLDYDSDLQPKFFDFRGSGESYFGLSQSFEFPGKRSIRGKIASKESHELLQEIDLLKLDIVFQVKRAFYGLLLAQEKMKYARQNLELAQDFQNKARLKFEAGDVAKVEYLRARVEALKADNAVKSSENDVRLAKAQLNFLLARKKYSPLEIQGQLSRDLIELDIDVFFQRALSFRPEIKRTKFSLEKEGLRKKQGTLSYLPDFDVGVSRHRIDGEGTFWDVTVSLPIPLFFWQPKKGEIAEAQANISSLQKELEHLKNAISLEVEEAYTNALTAGNQIKLFEDEILAQAEEVYEMFLFSYQEGEIGGIELIEARKTLIEARLSYADALYNYDIALADLEKSIGQDFKGAEQ
ncbi:MAG: TolC family protein [Candidatus Aminicenantes bacterium]|nr:TolC family protein [Candidatus Aminicenantes bacterium]